MRLIDADALHDHIYALYRTKEQVQGLEIDEHLILLTIENTSTIDPDKHGRWEITDAYPHWMCCSVCHKAVVRNIEVIERYEIPTSFCPNCGARMDKEDT
jgi:hypothetical protein